MFLRIREDVGIRIRMRKSVPCQGKPFRKTECPMPQRKAYGKTD